MPTVVLREIDLPARERNDLVRVSSSASQLGDGGQVSCSKLGFLEMRIIMPSGFNETIFRAISTVSEM